MDPASFAALQQLIQQLASGGTPEQRQQREQIQEELKANSLRQQQYSKEAAQEDSAAAVNAQMTQALEQLIPTISAGIDAAGTSGSAMAALLSQDAAERASRQAAQLGLEAAISYGQIANQASGNNVSLLQIEDPVMKNLLEALNIAKGAQTSSTTKTSNTERWNEVINQSGISNTSSTSNTSNWQNNFQSGNTTTQTTGPSSSTTTTSPNSTINNMGNRGGLTTPSSYSQGTR